MAEDAGRTASDQGRLSGSRREQPNSRRSRTNGKACVNCHRRKVRCDALVKGIPCSNCQTQNRPGCRIYEKPKKGVFLNRPAGDNIPIQPREALHQGQKAVTAPATPVSIQPQAGTTGDAALAFSGSRSSSHDRHPYASPSAATHAGDYEDEQASRNLAEFISRDEIRVRVLNDQSRLYFIGTEVSNLNYLVVQRSRNLGHTGLHFGTRQLARKYTAHEFKQIPSGAVELPEKSLADDLVQAYFVHVNRGWPIVDEVDFMEKYNGNNPQRQVPLLLLHAIFLVGSHVLSSKREDLKELKRVSFRKAKALFDSRFEQDRAIYIQVALLMTWNSDGLEDVVANCWHWIGLAARTALGMGMHRDASQSSMTDGHKRLWVRLWWVLYQFDVMVSTFYGRPQAINLDDSDVPDLQPAHFEGIPQANIDFVIQHTRLCVIFSKAMRKRVALRSTPSEKAVATREADEALADFVTSLPEHLRLPLAGTNIWKSVLHLTYNTFVILLHRPPPHPAPRFDFHGGANDLIICGDAAMVVTSIFETLSAKDILTTLCMAGNNAIFTTLVYFCSELDSTNPLVAAKSLRVVESLLNSLRALSCHWLYARSLLRLFEERVSRHRQQGGPHLRSSEAPADEGIMPTSERGHAEGPVFNLRPNPFNGSSAYFPQHQSTRDVSSPNFQRPFPTAGSELQRGQTYGQGPLYPGQNSPVLNTVNGIEPQLNNQGSEVGPSDPSQSHHYGGNFFGGVLDMSDGTGMGLDTISFSETSALEFLLAGIDTEYGF